MTKATGILSLAGEQQESQTSGLAHCTSMGFISAILEHEVIVSLLLAGTVLGTVSKHECGGPLHTQSARESGAEKGSWKGHGRTYDRLLYSVESCLSSA